MCLPNIITVWVEQQRSFKAESRHVVIALKQVFWIKSLSLYGPC
uniref:Uncharacterized protein n=1 Tax=Anguilla anguilla TaxID=7936 RepID=A0A0E9WHX0_ANGAN